MDINLPSNLCDFLNSGEQLQYDASQCEPGQVRLAAFDDLQVGDVWIGTDMKGDPRFGEDGYYAVPAVSLLSEFDGYDPNFVLLWLPSEQKFGSWDCDHWVLTVFQSAGWSDIVEDPATYLNAQWDARNTVGQKFIPWPRYEFAAGMPF